MGGGNNLNKKMENTYIVAWAAVVKEDDSGIIDFWQRCETLDEAESLYKEAREHNALYTASIAKEIQSTES